MRRASRKDVKIETQDLRSYEQQIGLTVARSSQWPFRTARTSPQGCRSDPQQAGHQRAVEKPKRAEAANSIEHARIDLIFNMTFIPIRLVDAVHSGILTPELPTAARAEGRAAQDCHGGVLSKDRPAAVQLAVDAGVRPCQVGKRCILR